MPTRVVPLDEVHLPNILRWLGDEDLRDHIGTVFPVMRAQHAEWYRSIASDRTRLVLAIETPEGGGHVGMVGLSAIDMVYRTAELWLYIGEESARGSGAARFAFDEVVRFGFDTLGLNRIYVQVFAFNERAQRFFARCGMTLEGTLREAVYKKGRFHAKLVFGLLAREVSHGTR